MSFDQTRDDDTLTRPFDTSLDTPIPNPLKTAMLLGMQTCLDALAQQVVVLDAQARVVFGNRAWREFIGAKSESWRGRPFAECYLQNAEIDLGARDRVIRSVMALIDGRLEQLDSEVACAVDGQDFWFTVHAERMPDGGVLISHHDISEMRQLDDARTRFAALANDSAEYVLLLHPDGRVDYANLAARRLGQRLATAASADALHPELERWTSFLATRADMFDAARHEGAWRGELVLPTSTGDDVQVKATVQAKGAENGSTVHFSVVLNDVTLDKRREEELHNRHVELELAYAQLKDAQEQLLQSEKMASIGQLASGVAHEINNPIGYVHSNLGTLQEYTRNLFTLIDGYERFVQDSGADSAAAQEIAGLRRRFDVDFLVQDLPQLLAESREGIERVKKIVQDLKDFSHAGQSDEWVLADLHKGLDSTLNIVWNELKYKAEVHKHYGELPLVECLPMQINQVFMNILVNAGHAIRERGVITMTSGVEGDHVWIAIADNGEGVPEPLLQRIFDPFFTTKPVGQGTGLGLSLSYGIIKKHHGRIEVRSKPGEGAEFRIVLPIMQPRTAIASTPQA